MTVASRMEDGVYSHAIDINRFEEGMKRRTIGFLKEMSDDINRLLSDSPTLLQSDRMKSLLDQVDGVIADAHQTAKVDMRNQLLDFAPVEEKATTKIMNDSLEADLFSPKMTSMQLQAVVDDSLIRGALGSKWWDRLEENTKNKITKGIQLGIAEGESMSQIKTRLLGKTTGEFETYEVGGKTRRRMKRVGGWIQVSNREAEAVIRTSVHSVASSVRDKTYLANLDVIDQVQSVATLDGRTTPICASYDGLRWTADGHKPVGGHGKVYLATPRHWNCRSTHVPVLDELDKLDAIAKTKGIKIPPATRASMKGRLFEVHGMKSMDDWLKTQDIPIQNALVGGAAKGALYRTGKIKLKDFTGRRGDPISVEDLRAKFNILKAEVEKPSVAVGEKISPFGRHTRTSEIEKAGNKWRESIYGDKREGVLMFTDDSYTKMRAIMRGYKVDSLDPRLDETYGTDRRMFRDQADFDHNKKLVKDFRGSLKTAPEFEGTAWRGVSVPDDKLDRILKKLEKTGTMKLRADSSATRRSKTATNFLKSEGTTRTKKRVLYWFNQRSGKSIERASTYSKEQEVVIEQKTRFDLVKVHRIADEVNLNEDGERAFDMFPDADIIIELEEI